MAETDEVQDCKAMSLTMALSQIATILVFMFAAAFILGVI
jgi:hypothetical protein